jgi:hypothetical protein
VTLRFIGVDPDSPNNGSPTVWLDDADGSIVIQGWKITDQRTMSEITAAKPVPDHDLIHSTTARGVGVRRLRIVSEPVTDYVRFEYDVTAGHNIAAGEDVRWLPRHMASGLLLPAEDFWIFDGQVVLWNHFAGDSSWVGEEQSDDPALAKLCASSFDVAWERGVPHEDYQPA